MNNLAEPSELMRQVFLEHTERYGDPDVQFHFDRNNSTMRHLEYLDVFVWEPKNDIPMTTFSTIGMADTPMPGCSHRGELHWTLRGTMDEIAKESAAAFLLGIAEFPFLKNTFLDYWHILPKLQIPGFKGCSAALLHPALTDGGWEKIEVETQTVKLLNFVPITDSEFQMAKTMGVNRMLNALYESQTDIFSDRV